MQRSVVRGASCTLAVKSLPFMRPDSGRALFYCSPSPLALCVWCASVSLPRVPYSFACSLSARVLAAQYLAACAEISHSAERKSEKGTKERIALVRQARTWPAGQPVPISCWARFALCVRSNFVKFDGEQENERANRTSRNSERTKARLVAISRCNRECEIATRITRAAAEREKGESRHKFLDFFHQVQSAICISHTMAKQPASSDPLTYNLPH